MTRQTPPVRIGIIGCGNVLRAYRASLDKLRLRGAAEVVMACGRAGQRAAASGDIGKPCSARARYGWAGPSWSEWFYKPGGGCLFDLGVYCITSLTGLLGPAKRVQAMTGIAIPEREINGRKIQVQAEDNAQVLLDFG